MLKRPINAVSAFITTGGMPERAREILGLPWDERRERRYQRFAAIVRALAPVYDRLPAATRVHPIALSAYQREGRRP